jgi:hypothetical protein
MLGVLNGHSRILGTAVVLCQFAASPVFQPRVSREMLGQPSLESNGLALQAVPMQSQEIESTRCSGILWRRPSMPGSEGS